MLNVNKVVKRGVQMCYKQSTMQSVDNRLTKVNMQLYFVVYFETSMYALRNNWRAAGSSRMTFLGVIRQVKKSREYMTIL